MENVINKTAEIIRNALTEKQRKSLYKVLEKIGGKTGEQSIFNRIAHKIREWKPVEFTKTLLKLVGMVFNLEGMSELAKKGFNQAAELQKAIDAKTLTSADAGGQLRVALKKDPIAVKLNAPNWLINFLSEGVVLALRILKGI